VYVRGEARTSALSTFACRSGGWPFEQIPIFGPCTLHSPRHLVRATCIGREYSWQSSSSSMRAAPHPTPEQSLPQQTLIVTREEPSAAPAQSCTTVFRSWRSSVVRRSLSLLSRDSCLLPPCCCGTISSFSTCSVFVKDDLRSAGMSLRSRESNRSPIPSPNPGYEKPAGTFAVFCLQLSRQSPSRTARSASWRSYPMWMIVPNKHSLAVYVLVSLASTGEASEDPQKTI
jgi:hypothetical protein